MDNMNQVHEMLEKLLSMGATEEDCKQIIKIAYAVADKIIKES